MQLRSFHIILTTAFLVVKAISPLSAHAAPFGAQSSVCGNEILTSVKAQLRLVPKNGDPGLIDLHEPTPTSLVNNHEPSARIAGEESGIHGGNLHVVEKTGATWLSYFAPERDAYQGDPRRFAQIVGSKAAYFFGFRRIGKNKITIPDAKELSGAIYAMNGTLSNLKRETIGIRFYSTGNEKTSEVEFLKRFAYEKAFPISKGGTLELHDISYHLIQAVLPNRLIDHGAKITQRLLEFTEFLQNKAADPTYSKSLSFLADKKIIETLIKERSRELDTLGNYAHYKGRKFTQVHKREETAKLIGAKAYFDFAHGGASADQYLRDKIDSLLPHQLTRRDPGSQLKRLLDEFNQQNPDPATFQVLQFTSPANRPMGIKRGFFSKQVEPKDSRYDQEVEEINRLIDKKRASIAEAALQFAVP